MALIHCPECNKEISDTVKACPHCGYRIKKTYNRQPKKNALDKIDKKKMKLIYIIVGIVIILVSVFILFIVINPNDTNVSSKMAIKSTLSPDPTQQPTPSPTPKSTEDVYDSAVKKYNQGEIWLAEVEFIQIPNYEDSQEYLNRIEFAKGIQGTWAVLISLGDGTGFLSEDEDMMITFNGLEMTRSRTSKSNWKVGKYEDFYYLFLKFENKGHIIFYSDNALIYCSDAEFDPNGNLIDFDENKYLSYKKASNETEVTLKVKPYIGMTREQLENDCTWGRPKDINTTTTAYGTNEQWCYSDYRFVYLEDGIVTGIQE